MASVDIWMHSASTHFVLVGATRVLIIYPAKKKTEKKQLPFSGVTLRHLRTVLHGLVGACISLWRYEVA